MYCTVGFQTSLLKGSERSYRPPKERTDCFLVSCTNFMYVFALIFFAAVVYHHGKHATGGHYTCDVYHHGLEGWLRFDDSLIKRVSEQQVLKHVAGRVAYLLYFKRCDLS